MCGQFVEADKILHQCRVREENLSKGPSLTFGCCGLFPAARVGGGQAGRALLVLRRLDG